MQRIIRMMAVCAMLLGAGWPAATQPVPTQAATKYSFADSAFDLVWTRTDADVAAQRITRGWVW